MSYVPYSSAGVEDRTIGACQCALIDFFQAETSSRSLLNDKFDYVENIGTASSNAQFLIRRDGVDQNSSSRKPSDSCHTLDAMAATHAAVRNMTEDSAAETYTEAYFTHLNPSFPVLDHETLLATDPVDSGILVLVSAILLVGAHVSSPRGPRETTKPHLYRRAKDLFDAQIDAGISREVLVQAALLLSWVSETCCAGTTAWYWLNMANTIATELGMHRDADRSSAESRVKSRWRRLWWLLFHSQVQICFRLGRPQIIDLEQCDVQMIKLEDLNGYMETIQAEVFLQSIRLAIVQSRVLRDCFRPTVSPARHAARARAETELLEWKAQVPEHLFADEGATWTPDLSMLWLSYLSTFLLLRRPQSIETRLRATCTATDAAVCKIAASRIATLLADLRESDRLKYQPQYIVHIAFSALIELFVETLLPGTDGEAPAKEELDSVRASMIALGRFWPDANTILERFDVSAPLLTGQKDNVSADIEELQVMEADRGAGCDCDSRADGMECEPAAHEDFAESADSLGAEQRMAPLFGEGMDKADLRSVLREWKRWRQFYWRWSHIRCV